MSRVKVYSTGHCPICERAKGLLDKWSIPYTEVRVDLDRSGLREMARVARGARSVPQIAIDGQWIGSLTELTELHMEHGLDHLVKPSDR